MGSSDDGDRLFHPSSSDELSSFLRQILSRTPTAQSFSPTYMVNQPQQPPKRIVHSVEMFDRTFPSDSGVAVSSAGYAVAETSEDRYAFQNKRNGGRQRNSLKKNIDAQLHNLSEKRRRRKINEKMKALQKVLPNSNKSDKASMLDEAIEYLKQLQLQVQTLAVMNGFGLNPMRLPPVLPPIHTRINETFKQEMNLESLPGASHSLVYREPAEGIQEMCFSTATLL